MYLYYSNYRYKHIFNIYHIWERSIKKSFAKLKKLLEITNTTKISAKGVYSLDEREPTSNLRSRLFGGDWIDCVQVDVATGVYYSDRDRCAFACTRAYVCTRLPSLDAIALTKVS